MLGIQKLNSKRKILEADLSIQTISFKKYEQFIKKQFRQRNLISEFVFGNGDFLTFEELIKDENEGMDFSKLLSQKSSQNRSDSHVQQQYSSHEQNTENIMDLDTDLEINQMNNNLNNLSFQQIQSQQPNDKYLITTNKRDFFSQILSSFQGQPETQQSKLNIISEDNRILKILEDDNSFENNKINKKFEDNFYEDYQDELNDLEDQIEIIDFGEIDEVSYNNIIQLEEAQINESQASQNVQMDEQIITQKLKLMIGENKFNKIKKVIQSSQQSQYGVQKKIRKNKLCLVKFNGNKQKLYLIKRK